MTRKNLIFSAAVFAAIVSTTLFCVMWRQHRREADTMQDRVKVVITDEPLPMLARPSYASIDEEQRDKLKAIFDSVVVAYSNLQYNTIQETEALLLEGVEHLTDKDYRYVAHAFFELLYCEIVSSRVSLSRFSSAEELKMLVLTDFAAIRLYGKLVKRRKDYNQFFHWIEAKELKRLSACRKLFVDEGNAEYAKATDWAIEKWIDHIESPQGFTRTMTLYYLERGKIWVPSPSEQRPPDWERIRQRTVRQGAEPLVSMGYRPKWVDELMKTPEPEAYRAPRCY